MSFGLGCLRRGCVRIIPEALVPKPEGVAGASAGELLGSDELTSNSPDVSLEQDRCPTRRRYPLVRVWLWLRRL